MKGLSAILGVALAATACNDATPTPLPDANARPAASAPAEAPAGVASGPQASADAPVMDDCPHGGDHASCGESEPPTAAAGPSHFGSAFVLKESQSLATAAASLKEPADVQVEGKVDSVCKKRGCWMVLRDGETTARIFTHAGDFLLPTTTARGRTAVVEGKLEARTMSPGFAKHLAEDEGKDPSEVEAPQRELVIQAKAVALR